VSTSYLTHSLKDFHETWLKCLSSLKQCANGKIKSSWPKVKVTLFKWLGEFLLYLLTLIFAIGSVKKFNKKLSCASSCSLGT